VEHKIPVTLNMEHEYYNRHIFEKAIFHIKGIETSLLKRKSTVTLSTALEICCKFFNGT
jgi:hypothetical protein